MYSLIEKLSIDIVAFILLFIGIAHFMEDQPPEMLYVAIIILIFGFFILPAMFGGKKS